MSADLRSASPAAADDLTAFFPAARDDGSANGDHQPGAVCPLTGKTGK